MKKKATLGAHFPQQEHHIPNPKAAHRVQNRSLFCKIRFHIGLKIPKKQTYTQFYPVQIMESSFCPMKYSKLQLN